ncbi:Sn1-specific diacylglycerol lipase beta [Madurella mycetomatis]|uniref:sn-1-specific diacylglycerol lipase n=1 Tax=Madurella mycetomatis TaxID=100816 RepID=A0A175W5J1_9PEZI|nr:Sn1-specific diacylglycerol lipase beta [Madurella mycetomatis]
MTLSPGDGVAAADSDVEGSRLAVIPGENMAASSLNDTSTLLPAPVARAVSFATRSTGLAIRMGSVIGGYGIDVAKFTTLSSFELGRAMLEGILSRAGRDAVSRSDSDLARADVESILETAVGTLHRAMGHVVFWTAAGFNVTSTTLSFASETSQLLLSMLDQFFGSTDSSRAIASIVAMIRREFENPATGVQGETVSLLDLVMGLCSMAYLQRSCRSLLQEESRTSRIEETVWDVVVLSDGARVNVHNDVRIGTFNSEEPRTLQYGPAGPAFAATRYEGGGNSDQDGLSAPTLQLQREIMRCLPDDAEVSITRAITTSETITVEITGGAHPLKVAPPPGLELIEESWDTSHLRSRPQTGLGISHGGAVTRSRLVFRHNRHQETTTSFQRMDRGCSHIEVDLNTLESSASESEKMAPRQSRHSNKCGELRPFRQSASASKASALPAPLAMSSETPLMPKHSGEHAADRKRSRTTPDSTPSTRNARSSISSPTQPADKLLYPRSKDKPDSICASSEKKSGFRNVLKKPMSIFSKEDFGFEIAAGGKETKLVPGRHSTSKAGKAAHRGPSDLVAPSRESSLLASNPTSPTQGAFEEARRRPRRTPSGTSFLSVRESLCESAISLTETYSTSIGEHRRVSVLSEATISSPVTKKVEPDREVHNQQGAPDRDHRRLKSRTYTPSIYTLRANASETSLIPYHTHDRWSAFSGTEALGTLKQAGVVDGMFPAHHLLRNITRYMRFASASYGSKFLTVLGIATQMPIPGASDNTHHELRSFAHHTKSNPSSILLSSFIDPQGGSDGTGSTNTGVPLVHYISLDHESKTVVLTCRGTLGFEDVLADMTCEYDDLVWRGKSYKVHKGVHASARRLLYGGDGRVLYTLKTALEEFPGYGLVLAGHSLGGAVTSLLGVMLSEPNPFPGPSSSFFITASSEPHTNLLPPVATDDRARPPPLLPPHICLPANRPIHVYAYGPPSTMSSALRAATRGLVTTVVHGNDLVPFLSLGVLHDFQAAALALKTDNSAAKSDLRQRVWTALRDGVARAYRNDTTAAAAADAWVLRDEGITPAGAGASASSENEYWAYAALKVLRSSMLSEKLVPPGEVFVVESQRALRGDAFVAAAGGNGEEDHLGRPAHRVVLKYVRDVERRFGEVRFGVSMLTDHNPAKYEATLERLMVGVLGRGVD